MASRRRVSKSSMVVVIMGGRPPLRPVSSSTERSMVEVADDVGPPRRCRSGCDTEMVKSSPVDRVGQRSKASSCETVCGGGGVLMWDLCSPSFSLNYLCRVLW